jgi:SAM-dependent methyltransferase
MGGDDPVSSYDRMGSSLRRMIESMLPDDWSWSGQRVLDFGCGAGRVLRHFAPEATDGEFWGCDIDGPSIEWLRQNLCPPFQAERCSESPGLSQPDGYFDLIYAISVFTHLSDGWADWLLELHRLLSEGGLLLATFLGEGMVDKLFGEQWNEDDIGMNALRAGNPWNLGGPFTLHSPWWIRAHWGRAFDIVAMKPHTGSGKPVGHGVVLLRRKPVRVTSQDLERLEPDEPRELGALRHHVDQLRRETLQLRKHGQDLEQRLDAADADCGAQLLQLQDKMRQSNESLAAIQGSKSWRLTAPLRAAKGVLKRGKL